MAHSSTCPNLRKLIKTEDGNVTVFSVFMLVLIIMITGAAVDIMRFEASRAKMQSTIDRAVLAAADLDQKADPTSVVNDYMDKAGVKNVVSNVVVDDGLNHRTVTASGSAEMDTIFLHMSGFDTLTAPAHAVAEEKISNVEVSVVLDVSGSMGGNRITNMQAAAREFIDTVIQPVGSPGLTTVSIVPYNATVNLGSTVSQYFTLENLHTYSNCVIFADDEFSTVGISPTETLTRLGHFDRYATSESSVSIARPWCKTGNTSAVVAHSDNKTTLKNHVNSLTAGGNTAIDIGMKWGVALLDPLARPAINSMAAAGHSANGATGRPAEYTDPEAIKFVVVMTDGENTSQYDLEPEYKYGMSDIWIDDRNNSIASDDRFSVLVRDWSGTSNDKYYWPRYDGWSQSYRYRSSVDGGGNARRMSNAEVYARFGVKAVAKKFYEDPKNTGYISYRDYIDMYYGTETIVNGYSADSRLASICAAARDKGIVIFAIGFEAPSGGQRAMKDCASSEAHYFDVTGVEITETFHAIARQINSLRLVQ